MHKETRTALPDGKPGDHSVVCEAQFGEFNSRVIAQVSGGAVFEFSFGNTISRRQDVALLQGHIGKSSFPTRQDTLLGRVLHLDVAIHHTQANNARIRSILGRILGVNAWRKCKNQDKNSQKRERN
ncbi:MAG TPA: hypothetical protein VGG55_06135 [Candidatus Acidoferrales bacterium]